MARQRKKTTANPPAVSGPGALSERTDQSLTQPIREIPGQPYGERQRLTRQQQAAPLPAGGETTPAAVRAGVMPRQMVDPFGPTERPREPISSGMFQGAGRSPSGTFVPPDPDALLRAMYAVYPHPHIARMMSKPKGVPEGEVPMGNEIEGLDRPAMVRNAARAVYRPTRYQMPPRRPSA